MTLRNVSLMLMKHKEKNAYATGFICLLEGIHINLRALHIGPHGGKNIGNSMLYTLILHLPYASNP